MSRVSPHGKNTTRDISKFQNSTRLTAREVTYNNFEISLVVFVPCGEIRDMSGRSYFPRLINLSINDFSSAISYWFTVAKVSWKFCSAASATVMSRTMAARKSITDLFTARISTKGWIIFQQLLWIKWSEEIIEIYFEAERLIVERKSREEVSRAACHSFRLYSFLADIYLQL